MYKPTKLGRVTFVDADLNASKGAFIKDLSAAGNAVADKIFVPAELLKAFTLTEGQLVEFEEVKKVAVNIKPLAR